MVSAMLRLEVKGASHQLCEVNAFQTCLTGLSNTNCKPLIINYPAVAAVHVGSCIAEMLVQLDDPYH
jgi:hypothetical protein